MLYVQARIIGEDEHALMTRCYLAALARVEHVPLRALWVDASAVQPELLEQEVRIAYSLGERPIGPVTGVLRVGAAAEVVGAPVEAPYSIAVTWWPPKRLTRAVRARLDAFSEVWVPHEKLRDDYPRAAVVPVPFGPEWVKYREARPAAEEREPVAYVIGRWATGQLEEHLETALAWAELRAGRVVLIAPDAPFTNGEQYRNLYGLPEAPPLVVDPSMPSTFSGVRRAHLVGSHYAGPEGFHAAAARAIGNEVIGDDGMAEEVDAEWGASWAEIVAERLTAALADVEPLPEASPVPAGTGLPQPIFTVIVPVRDVDLDDLEECIRSVQVQLFAGDEIIVSAQGDSEPEALRALAVERRLTLVEDDYAGIWNIARARNAGFLAARRVTTMAPRYVIALDHDIRMPQGWLADARRIVMEQCYRETVVFVPQVADTDGERVRIGSGVALLPRGLVETARGWDEQYYGYGSEDLDLIHRLRTDLGARLVMLDAKALEPLLHVPHDERPERREYGPASLKRLEARIRGQETGHVNTGADSWVGRWRSTVSGSGEICSAPCRVTVLDGQLEETETEQD